MGNSLLLHPMLYVSQTLSKSSAEKIKKQLQKDAKKANCHLIVQTKKAGENFEIYHAGQLSYGAFADNAQVVVGIAQDYEDAQALLVKIFEDCMAEIKKPALGEYFACYGSF